MEMVDAGVQRRNMVESQVRPSEISDRRIPRAMESIEREKFLPEALQSLAYLDRSLTLPGRAGSIARSEHAPRILAKLMQAANIQATDVILDVGSASGWSSALLAQIGETVVALECDRDLADRASAMLSQQAIDNVAVVVGPLAEGYPKAGPYDVIVLQGATADAPQTLFEQLKDGGRLVAVVRGSGLGQACCWQRHGTTLAKRICFDANADFLPGFEPVEAFTF